MFVPLLLSMVPYYAAVILSSAVVLSITRDRGIEYCARINMLVQLVILALSVLVWKYS